MNYRTTLLLCLPIFACKGDPETGIDRTFIRGVVEIPAGEFQDRAG